MIVFGLAEGNAAHSSAVVPGGSVVITEETEDPVSLQRPVSTHNEPALPRLPLFLQGEDVGVKQVLCGAQAERWQLQVRGSPADTARIEKLFSCQACNASYSGG